MSEQKIDNTVILQAITELSNDFKDFKQSVESRFDSMEQRLDSMEKRQISLEERFDTLEERFDSMEKNLSEQIEKIDVKFSILTDEILSTQADVKILQKAK